MIFGFPFSAKPETLNTLLYLVPNSLIFWAVIGCAVLVARQPGPLPFEGIAFLVFAALGFALHAVLAAYPRMLMPLIPIALWFVFTRWGRSVAPYLSRTRGTYDAVRRRQPELSRIEVDPLRVHETSSAPSSAAPASRPVRTPEGG